MDTAFKNTPQEKAYRAFKAGPKPWWHRERLQRSTDAKDWYAATFHAAWLLNLDSNSQSAYDGFNSAWGNLDDEQKALLPNVVKTAKALPKPPDA